MASKGITVSWATCVRRLRNLKQTYKNIKDNNGCTGRGHRSWEFYEQMDKLHGKDQSVMTDAVVESRAAETTAAEANAKPADDQIAGVSSEGTPVAGSHWTPR